MPKECCKEMWEKIPEDEPVFILRGKDLLVVPVIRKWLDAAKEAGVDEDKIRRAVGHLYEIQDFQKDYPDRCKIPD